MAKLDKSQYTKEQWKVIREKRRKEKQDKLEAKLRIADEEQKTKDWQELYGERAPDKLHKQNYVLCLKHGNKYSSQYVNVLYSMVKRNLTIPFKFVCLTDDPRGLDKDIQCLELPKELSGWWCKPYMYSANLPLAQDLSLIHISEPTRPY